MSEQELQEMIKVLEADRIRNTATPEAAEQYLREMGFLDAEGELKTPYAKEVAGEGENE